MTRKLLPVALLAGWLTVAATACGSSDRTTASDHMGHTTMTSSHPAKAMGGDSNMSTMQMPGMTPLVSGADGTHPSAAGLTLHPTPTQWTAGRQTTWKFRITDAKGMLVTRFQRDQTKLLHLIVARWDLTGYQHLHPTLAGAGVWSIPITLEQPGRYRAIADFTTAGKRYALGVNLTVPGNASALPLPAPAPTASVDGYTVTIKHGPLHAAGEAQIRFTVATDDGKPVTDLQQYLGAYGHLVALRKADLAYSHVHPSGEDLMKGSIVFVAELPTAVDYRLFLQFRAGGNVHTAAFTLRVAM